MNAPVWVLLETVLAVHEQLVAQFGGSTGVRDQGLLESALAWPQNLLVYESSTVFELAASYAFGIVKNHPFVDGNKRSGFMAAVLFLELNGYQFEATETDATIRTLALATGELAESGFAAWLDASSRKR
jgi:death on curing protein